MPQRPSEWLAWGAAWALWLGLVAALGIPSLWLVWQGYLRVVALWPMAWLEHPAIALFAVACVIVLRWVEKIASLIIPVD